MSCIFCNSFHHLSQNCDVHVSNAARESYAERKQICVKCLSKSCILKTSGFMLTKCKAVNGCCICYSKNHQSAFCPDRFTAPNFFIPNTDHDLLPRFLAMLDIVEKQFLAIQSPAMFSLCKLQPLTAVNVISPFRFKPPEETKAVVCKKIELSYTFSASFFYNTKHKTIFAENVKFIFGRISPQNVYVLLSTRTKSLMLKSAKFSSTFIKITMDEIFTRAPNLEVFEYDTCHDISWLADNFFHYNYPKSLKSFKFTVFYNADIEKIIPFIKKCPSSVKIELYFNITISYRYDKQAFADKISNFFVPAKPDDNLSVLFFIEKPFATFVRYSFVGLYILRSSLACFYK